MSNGVPRSLRDHSAPRYPDDESPFMPVVEIQQNNRVTIPSNSRFFSPPLKSPKNTVFYAPSPARTRETPFAALSPPPTRCIPCKEQSAWGHHWKRGSQSSALTGGQFVSRTSGGAATFQPAHSKRSLQFVRQSRISSPLPGLEPASGLIGS